VRWPPQLRLVSEQADVVFVRRRCGPPRMLAAPRPELLHVGKRWGKHHHALWHHRCSSCQQASNFVQHGMSIPSTVREPQTAPRGAAGDAQRQHTFPRNHVATLEALHTRQILGLVELVDKKIKGCQGAAGQDDRTRVLNGFGKLAASVEEQILDARLPVCTLIAMLSAAMCAKWATGRSRGAWTCAAAVTCCGPWRSSWNTQAAEQKTVRIPLFLDIVTKMPSRTCTSLGDKDPASSVAGRQFMQKLYEGMKVRSSDRTVRNVILRVGVVQPLHERHMLSMSLDMATVYTTESQHTVLTNATLSQMCQATPCLPSRVG
jgi:hypothetical protein